MNTLNHCGSWLASEGGVTATIDSLASQLLQGLRVDTNGVNTLNHCGSGLAREGGVTATIDSQQSSSYRVCGWTQIV
ncbi:hypothetical protein [Pseudomonas sp. RIT-PI-q]|uniref:hypothetical protein n=1 Tax=Pseudomonas sp. RIT-PI-q TaxID=1690247 RepID=UPI000AE5F444|nr:hypothetical protein [Pseudomonas sp. RIT-PI-q]